VVSLNLPGAHLHPLEAERSLLIAIAGQVGLPRTLLYRAEQRAHKPRTIRAASLAVTQTLDLDEVLETLLENLRLLVTYDRARVMLVEGASRLRVEVAFVNGQARFLRERPITFDPATNPVINNVLTTLRGTLIPDIHTHPEWGSRMRPEFDHSWMGVPLVAGGKAIGLYSLSKTEPGSFSEEDLLLAEALSAPASVAIQNAALFKEVLAGSERLQTLSRKLVELQEDERRRVSRELHDEAGQAHTSLLFTLRLLEREAGPDGAVAARTEDLRRIADSVGDASPGRNGPSAGRPRPPRSMPIRIVGNLAGGPMSPRDGGARRSPAPPRRRDGALPHRSGGGDQRRSPRGGARYRRRAGKARGPRRVDHRG
jgi:GAF domain-containing protein